MHRHLRRLGKLIRAARCRRWRAALLQGVLAGSEHADALSGLAPRTVLDIGANKGQFALFARVAFPDATLHAFEPLPEAAARFRRVLTGDDAVSLHELAVAPRAGRRILHVARRGDSSSLLPIGARQAAVFPGTDAVATVEVAAAPLDAVLPAEAVAPPALLKLDVQGFELAALEGCRALLARVAWVYCECSFHELYTGQALYPDIVAFLERHGFREAGQFNAVTHPRLGRVQADVLFRRPSESR